MNQFAERYKSSSNFDLFIITKSPEDYQPDAVAAAKNELEIRNLSTEELEVLETEYLAEKERSLQKQEKRHATEDKAKRFGKSVLNTLHPIQESPPTTKKLILLISLVFGAISIYKLYQGLPFLLFMITEGDMDWDFSLVEYFVPVILLPIAVVLFWFRRMWGWILLSTFLTFTILNSISLLILTWNMESHSGFFEILPSFSTSSLALFVVVNSSFLWLLFRKDIWNVYGVDRKLAGIAVGFTTAIALLMAFSYL
ncbi:hypothetical protein [Owenweeksia hongkongensis]|uniref:hypothetical protein n=1 Tax=Owenweeksia hongkongensis TaxID=253245 RepID=UPI003A8FB0C9